MIASVSLDKPTLALMVIFVYLYFSERNLLAAFVGLLFITAKEPNIVFYGGFMAAVYLVMFFRQRGAGIVRRIKATFLRVQFLADIIPPMICAYLILFTGSWGSNNGIVWGYETYNSFGIVDLNTLSKNLQLGILNFNWLLLCGTVVLLLIFLKQYGIRQVWKSAKFWTYAVPLGALQLVFVGFQYIYYTYPNARYITPYEFVLSLGFGVLALTVDMKAIMRSAGMALTAGLLLVQSFVTIDPLTLKMFAKLDCGSAWVCSTEENGKFSFNQTMEYNRQYTYWDGVLRKVFADIDMERNVYFGYPHIEGSNFFAQFLPNWNVEREMFEYTVIGDEKYVNYPVDNCVLVEYGTITEEEFDTLREAGYESIYFIVPECYAEHEDVRNTLEKVTVKEEKEYTYRGWAVMVYEIEL